MSGPVSSPRASRLAWVLFGATLACARGGRRGSASSRGTCRRRTGARSGIVAAEPVGCRRAAPFPWSACVVATRQPRNAIGWIMLEIGLVVFLSGADGRLRGLRDLRAARLARRGAHRVPVPVDVGSGVCDGCHVPAAAVPRRPPAVAALALVRVGSRLSTSWSSRSRSSLGPVQIEAMPPGVENVLAVDGAQFLLVAFIWFPVAIARVGGEPDPPTAALAGVERAQTSGWSRRRRSWPPSNLRVHR